MAIFLSLRVIKKLGQRPCHVEYTSVDYDTDVKRHSVGTVLGWETSWELLVLPASVQILLLLLLIEASGQCLAIDLLR